MVKSGNISVDNSPMVNPKLPNFLRLTVASSKVNTRDMDFVINEIERIGKEIK